ncbi:MAG: response regulator transcription factor [Gemmatimonadaceae bacterium]|nr:response regulator transcription factor [Gemmatimonadaceae bacterium]
MKILVTDDDDDVRSLLVLLFRDEGYEAEPCPNGQQTLQRLSRGDVDLLTLDWNLGDMDGPDVCRVLRERGDGVPVLMVTARGDIPERITALQAGADGYLVKPFDPGELLARVRALLRRSRRDLP